MRPDERGERERGGMGLFVRAGIGGVLMGMANLVPGISGGTMLLACGVYRAFIRAVADVTTMRWSVRSIAVLGIVVAGAGVAIVGLAGPVVGAVLEARWAMYSLFIGLTLGGAPMLARMVRRAPGTRAAAIAGVAGGFVAMAALAVAQQMQVGAAVGGERGGLAMMFVAGVAGASAMVLPGVSGGYLLLVLGQYVPILASIDRLKDALTGGEWGAAVEEWRVVVPLGLGVVAGIVGVSNLLRWLLDRYERVTLGVLLGLLLGAVLGLWPFQRGVAPIEGDVIKGRSLSAEEAALVPREDWRVEVYSPGAAEIGGAIGLVVVGFGVTLGIARIGGRDEARDVPAGED